ncbi:MAG: hypothetical protein LLG20_18790 [Acidobacteriales bacterium]|nr:hypothetical protein [Terriglobales bacterium]
MSQTQRKQFEDASDRQPRPWWRDTHRFREHKPERQKTLRQHRGGRQMEGR